MSGSFLNNKNIILIFFCPLKLLLHLCGGYKNGGKKKHQEMHIPVAQD